MNPDNTTETLIRMEGKLDGMDTKLDGFRVDVTKLEHSVYGNGQPGVKQKVIALEAEVRALKWATGLAVGMGGIVTTILGYFFFK